MKKCLTMLLALALVLSFGCNAFAQAYYTLPEVRAQAAQGWHETYTDKYGREIKVDIEIDVFGEEMAPVLRAGYPGLVAYEGEHNSPQETLWNARVEKGGRGYTTYGSDYAEKIDMDKKYGEAYGMNLTSREAYEIFRDVLEAQGLSAENYLYDQPAELEVRCSIHPKTKEVVAPARYEFHLWPTLYKLPVMDHINNGLYWGGTGPICPTETCFLVRSKEEWKVNVISFVEQEKLAEDIPLCSVEQVIESIEEQIQSGHIQEVKSLHLGYILFNDPEIPTEGPASAYDIESWYLVPTWMLECGATHEPEKAFDENRHIEGEIVYSDHLMINAQTGEMYNWSEGEVQGRGYGDARYRGFIPWDDVK